MNLSKNIDILLLMRSIFGSKNLGRETVLFWDEADPFAVQRLIGHAGLQMATRYVQDVSKQTDEVIENSRKLIL